MSPHDEARFAKMIADFVEGSHFEPPFFGHHRFERLGERYAPPHGTTNLQRPSAKSNRLKMISPFTVTVISSNGCGRSAQITIGETVPGRC